MTTSSSPTLSIGVWIGSLVIGLLFAWACGAIARSKGRSVPLFAILGFFFSCITLVVVLVIPRRSTVL